ncbi:phospholipase [Xenorhabdus nematophila]|uniref:phospholipase n=2 Tax=Xenorhabdus nematophila TaxID=628 RepID=UPI000542BC29|nr:phospholipase [Xenorhabdus nematophila]CEE91162.1 FliA regulated lipase [Xenorhabdus nematophila str. Anatoliense]CEF32801.1 FliA regulated lipase [Xenorhabdus nematophila str. Websteri]AYA39431.1 phospholipase [Xenorhabdus nematophila]MBA0017997.1 phospholipase [Xenorhabdus nematophila]MCB4424499.1 phospholipase [Xenorhabdus nematophila]
MTLSVIGGFFSELGTYSLQENVQPQSSPTTTPPLGKKADGTHSASISLSENTKQASLLYQSLINNLSASAMAVPELSANDIAGKQSKRIDYELTLVTRDVYREQSLGIPGYERISDEELLKAGIDPDTLNDYSTGFQAGVYKHKGLYIVSFTGSNELQDFMTSINQGLGYKTKQYDQAIELAHKSLKVFGENIIFTGHSLGGGLATVAALATGKPAVIYNSAGVSDATLKNMGVSPQVAREMADSGLIRHYTVQHDWLSNLQKKFPVPKPMGNTIELEYEFDWQNIWNALPHKYGLHVFKAHFLEAVLELMTQQKPWLNNGDAMLASTDDIDEEMLSLREPSMQAMAMDNPAVRTQFEDNYQQIISQRNKQRTV